VQRVVSDAFFFLCVCFIVQYIVCWRADNAGAWCSGRSRGITHCDATTTTSTTRLQFLRKMGGR